MIRYASLEQLLPVFSVDLGRGRPSHTRNLLRLCFRSKSRPSTCRSVDDTPDKHSSPYTPLTTSRSKCRIFPSLSQVENKRTNHGSVLFELIMPGIVRKTAAPQRNSWLPTSSVRKNKIVAQSSPQLFHQVYNAWNPPGGFPYEKIGDARQEFLF